MPKRTSVFQQMPWDGGLNTSRDPGLIPPTQLTIADNCVITKSGSRKTRQGMSYWDSAYTVTHKASAGTTRTLTLSSVTGLSVGSVITVLHNDDFDDYYDGAHKISAINSLTVSYIATGSLTEATTAVSTVKFGLNQGSSVLAIADYWKEAAGANTRKTVALIGTSYYEYSDTGARTSISTHASNYTALDAPEQCVTEIFINKLIFAFDDVANTPKYWDTTTKVSNLSSLVTAPDQAPPNFSICRSYANRLWTNDKERPHRLHYSAIGTLGKWQGSGDSGALDIDPGDGDPDGITAIFPGFKGSLFVAKKNKLYRIVGDAPENYQVIPVSAGVGCVSHKSVVAVDQDEIVYASSRGFHFLSTTANFGDYEASFASIDIQDKYVGLQSNRVNYIEGVYVPDINSVVFAVSENGSSVHNTMYVFNTITKQWYEWPDIKCQALAIRTEDFRRRLYIGTDNGRILQSENEQFFDFGIEGRYYDDLINAGSLTTTQLKRGISLKLKSGNLYLDGNPFTVKAFKNLSVYFKPRGPYTFTASLKIDNQSIQSRSFSSAGNQGVLGVDFILGTTQLSSQPVLAPHTLTVDGIGRGCTITIDHTSADQELEIFGFAIEFESAEVQQEVIADA